jgi:glucose-6-phosphate 1-dehydrogenase
MRAPERSPRHQGPGIGGSRSSTTGLTALSDPRLLVPAGCNRAADLCQQIWSRERVAQVQIDVPEELDVADRAEFYAPTGAALDMLVTHTLIAGRVWVDTDRWRDVPFLLRTGNWMTRSTQRLSLLRRRPEGPVDTVPVTAMSRSQSRWRSRSGSLDIGLVTKGTRAGPRSGSARTTLDLEHVPGGTPVPPYVSLVHES